VPEYIQPNSYLRELYALIVTYITLTRET